MARALVVALAFVLAGCATATKVGENAGKVLVIACDGCALLDSTGACRVVGSELVLPAGAATEGARAAEPAVPECDAPQQPWVVNFDDVMGPKHAKPKIECR